MKSWRIGQRLGIGFGIGVVFLIAVGWLSLRGMAAMNASLQTIANERSVIVGFTNQVLQLSIDNARITMQLFMVSGPAGEQLLALNKENQRMIGVEVERIEKLLSTEEEKALFNEVKTLRMPYLDSRAEMKKLLAAGYRSTRALALSLIILAALAATVLGAAVTRRITTPVRDLTRTVQRVSAE